MRRAVPFLLLLALATACASGPGPSPLNPAPRLWTTPEGTRIHVLQTGWVSVKERFRELRGPAALRVLSIVTDGDWTEWMPIHFYAIEHPEGVVLIDTGETSRVHEAGYFRCDAATEWFYENQLRFSVAREDELDHQLRAVGLEPEQVRWVVPSHLHSDHMGGMRHVASSEFLISRRDWAGHRGALLCRIPEGVEPTLVDHEGEGIGAFPSSTAVTRDGAVRVVPTPGHTAGHQSVIYREGARHYLFAGDAVFDLARLEDDDAIAGIVEDVEAARETVALLERQLAEFETILLPAHDAKSGSRLTHRH